VREGRLDIPQIAEPYQKSENLRLKFLHVSHVFFGTQRHAVEKVRSASGLRSFAENALPGAPPHTRRACECAPRRLNSNLTFCGACDGNQAQSL